MDPIADMLTILRNANSALLPKVEMRHSKVKESIANILQKEGFITGYQVEGEKIKKLKITLKFNDRKGVFAGLKKSASLVCVVTSGPQISQKSWVVWELPLCPLLRD